MSRVCRSVMCVLLAAVSAACVPASEAAPPAGALGFALEPSAAARGEPFVTADGWTITIEKFALQVLVSASHSGPETNGSSSGSYEMFRFDAQKAATVFSRAISVGLASATINLAPIFLGQNGFAGEKDHAETIGLPAEIVSRFFTAPDVDTNLGGYDFYYGPSALLVLRAERAGRTIRINVTFGGYSVSIDEQRRGVREVVANDLVTLPVTVAAEALFHDETKGDLRFDEFAAADRDKDGIVTGPELARAATSGLGPLGGDGSSGGAGGVGADGGADGGHSGAFGPDGRSGAFGADAGLGGSPRLLLKLLLRLGRIFVLR